jgi:hypothetical protein
VKAVYVNSLSEAIKTQDFAGEPGFNPPTWDGKQQIVLLYEKVQFLFD